MLLAARGEAQLTPRDFSVAFAGGGHLDRVGAVVPAHVARCRRRGQRPQQAARELCDGCLRLLAWNIRQGGGSRLPAIAEALVRHDADILVLSEYRGGESALRLRETLARLGYSPCHGPVPPPGKSGVLIAARRRFRAHATLCDELPEPYQLVHVDIGRLRCAASTCRT